jgi:hypothetical protein
MMILLRKTSLREDLTECDFEIILRTAQIMLRQISHGREGCGPQAALVDSEGLVKRPKRKLLYSLEFVAICTEATSTPKLPSLAVL